MGNAWKTSAGFLRLLHKVTVGWRINVVIKSRSLQSFQSLPSDERLRVTAAKLTIESKREMKVGVCWNRHQLIHQISAHRHFCISLGFVNFNGGKWYLYHSSDTKYWNINVICGSNRSTASPSIQFVAGPPSKCNRESILGFDDYLQLFENLFRGKMPCRSCGVFRPSVNIMKLKIKRWYFSINLTNYDMLINKFSVQTIQNVFFSLSLPSLLRFASIPICDGRALVGNESICMSGSRSKISI